MITVEELYKYYGDEDEIKAVDGASFTCPDGQITGLLGPNGAGKTTTLRMIAGLIQPRSGTVIVDDVDVVRDPGAARRILGVQSDMTGVYPGVTEIQVGSYVFMDARYRQTGVPFKNSLFLIATVISKPRPDLAIIDTGHKSLSSEFGIERTCSSTVL